MTVTAEKLSPELTAPAGSFTVAYPELAASLKSLHLGLGTKHQPDCTRQILIRVTSTTVELSTFNYAMAAVVELGDVSDLVPGDMVVDFESFKQAATLTREPVSVLRATLVTVSADTGTPVVNMRDSVVPVLSDFSVGELPTRPDALPVSHTIDRREFADFAARAKPFVSNDMTRPVLRHVHLVCDETSLTLHSIDRYRAVVCRVPVMVGSGVQSGNILGVELGKMLPRLAADVVGLGFGELERRPHVMLTSGSTTFHFFAGDGVYPQIAALFERPAVTTTVVVDREALLKVVSRAKGLVEKHAPLLMTVTTNSITVVPRRAAGQPVVLPAVAAQTPPMADPWTTGINPSYFADALASVPGSLVTLEFSEPVKPIFFIGGEENFEHLVLPVRLNP